MKNLLALIVLFTSLWLPELLEQYYPIEGWMKGPISNTLSTIYVLMFFVLLINFTKATKVEK
jgi:hypothetical protein